MPPLPMIELAEDVRSHPEDQGEWTQNVGSFDASGADELQIHASRRQAYLAARVGQSVNPLITGSLRVPHRRPRCTAHVSNQGRHPLLRLRRLVGQGPGPDLLHRPRRQRDRGPPGHRLIELVVGSEGSIMERADSRMPPPASVGDAMKANRRPVVDVDRAPAAEQGVRRDRVAPVPACRRTAAASNSLVESDTVDWFPHCRRLDPRRGLRGRKPPARSRHPHSSRIAGGGQQRLTAARRACPWRCRPPCRRGRWRSGRACSCGRPEPSAARQRRRRETPAGPAQAGPRRRRRRR
jgi:hypothetical protein